jgi:hypothetical protein
VSIPIALVPAPRIWAADPGPSEFLNEAIALAREVAVACTLALLTCVGWDDSLSSPPQADRTKTIERAGA